MGEVIFSIVPEVNFSEIDATKEAWEADKEAEEGCEAKEADEVVFEGGEGAEDGEGEGEDEDEVVYGK